MKVFWPIHEAASQRLEPAPSLLLASLPPLTSAVVVTRCNPRIHALPHVVNRISTLLDTTERWSLLRACELIPSVHLLRRIHALEQRIDLPVDRFQRDWEFNQCINRVAAAAGNLEVVQWFATQFSPGNLVTEGAKIAAKNGHVDVLRWLVEEYGCAFVDGEELALALENNHSEVAQWLLARRFPDHRRLPAYEWGSISNYHLFSDRMYATAGLEFLQWVADECGDYRMEAGLAVAVSAGRLSVVKWLAQRIDQNRGASSSSVRVAVEPVDEKVAVDCIKWLHEQNYPWVKLVASVTAMNAVAASGELGAVLWLQANVQVSRSAFSTEAADTAAANGHLEMVQWLHNIHIKATARSLCSRFLSSVTELCSEAAMNGAAANGHLHVLQWLHDNISDGWTNKVMDTAAKHGHLDVVRWLHHNRSEGCTTDAMDKAAELGDLDLIQFLHDNRPEGCTPRAMDAAATNNHLAVVMWLHTNRTEGCSRSAMAYAARGGHLEMVKWLHENRTEGCTTNAIDDAIKYNRIEVVKWLIVNRVELRRNTLINSAAYHGHLEVVHWLSLHGPYPSNECTAIAMDMAAANGHLEVVKWLHENRSEGCTAQAMDRAAGNGHFDVVRYLRANC